MKTLNIQNAPKIETGFVTPENYFENFSSRITLEINQEKEPKIIPFYTKRKVWIYAVAAIFVIGLMIPLYNYSENSFSKIDDESLENYIVSSSSITEDYYAYELDKEDIKKINIELNIEDKTIENELTNNADLEQYFLN